jgi:HAD superfamily hydrolase (TIGR01549 family)
MCHMRPVRAVLLDLDDTLIVEESHAMAQIRATAALAGADPDSWEQVVLAAARAYWYATDYYPACQALGISSWEGLWSTFEGAHPLIAPLAGITDSYRHDTWTAALEAAGCDPELADRLSDRYIELQRAGHPLASGSDDLLEQARAAGPVVLVTNGPPDIQRRKIEQGGLGAFFSSVVISGELGIGKPDPLVFAHALETVGAPPEDALMVGDSWERDVEGALAAGLRAVWISHGRHAPRHDDRVIVAATAGDVRIG